MIGDYKTIQTASGAKLTGLRGGEIDRPRLRPMPLSPHTGARAQLFGRDAELAMAAQASPDCPVQLLGPDGIGKTALLRAIANGRSNPPEGVLFQTARRRTLDEILIGLYSSCWETDVPFVPSPAQVGQYLAQRRVVVILDDCTLDRDDLETLLDTAPGCTFLFGSEDRTLWALGTAEQLRGLDRSAAVRLLERELGGFTSDEDHAAAEQLAQRLDGFPQRLIEAATAVCSGKASLSELAAGGVAHEHADCLTADEQRILTLLGLLGGAALGAPHIAAVAGVPDADARLAALERRGWVKSSSPGYRLIRSSSGVAAHFLVGKLTSGLVEHMSSYASGNASPAGVVAEAEAIEATLRLAALDGRWLQALELARVSEAKLARSGAWVSWRRVLYGGLEAARSLGDDHAEAHMLHQLGSLAICVGNTEEAAWRLNEAMAIRTEIGDTEGAELTRHNIGQLGEGGPFWGGGGPSPGGEGRVLATNAGGVIRSSGVVGGRSRAAARWPHAPIALAVLLIILVSVGSVVALTHGGSRYAVGAHKVHHPGSVIPSRATAGGAPSVK